MMLRNEVSAGFSVRRSVLPLIVLFTSLVWVPIESLAQQATLAEAKTTWLIGRPESSTAPQILIPLMGRPDVASGSVLDSISRPVDSAASVRRPQNGSSGTLVVAKLFAPAALVRGPRNLRPESTRLDRRGAPELVATPYSLLDNPSADGPFRDGYDSNLFGLSQSLKAGELVTRPVDQGPRPLWQLSLGGWQLPVLLTSGTVSQTANSLPTD
jgi:hypothetical protein